MFPVQNSVNEKIQSFFDYPNVHKREEVLFIFLFIFHLFCTYVYNR